MQNRATGVAMRVASLLCLLLLGVATGSAFARDLASDGAQKVARAEFIVSYRMQRPCRLLHTAPSGARHAARHLQRVHVRAHVPSDMCMSPCHHGVFSPALADG